MARFVILLLLVFLTSCALTEEQCKLGDWQAIGLRDGADGRESDFVANHQKACQKFDVTVDVAQWEIGRQQGLISYCTPKEAYLRSAEGKRFKTFLCESSNADVLNRAALTGQRYFNITQEIRSLERERSTLISEYGKLSNDPQKASRLTSIQSRISWIDFEIRQLLLDRTRYDY